LSSVIVQDRDKTICNPVHSHFTITDGKIYHPYLKQQMIATIENTNNQEYNGFVLYSKNRKPFGVISPNGDRIATCNTKYIPSRLKQSLMLIEDHRFYKHGAVDIVGILRAICNNLKAGKIVEGGSTITQQLSRNILRDNRRNIIRKLHETALSFKLENKYSKDQILGLYFNNVFWGNNIYGVRAASLEYFTKEPENLSTTEQLVLLTLLRGPNYYLKNEDRLLQRYTMLSRKLYRRRVISSAKMSKLKRANFCINHNNLEVFRGGCVPYITESINDKQHSIYSTLDKEVQKEATRFINEDQFPTSVICVTNNKVIAVASSNGTDYPFTFKANVGSTLKPFIYCCLRENGIGFTDLLSTANNHKLDWNVREVQPLNRPSITLREALFLSNNNAFVNASFQVGIKRVLSFLARVTCKPLDSFVPASILGASIDGISLFELAVTYSIYFYHSTENPTKQECATILKEIALAKLDIKLNGLFLKTGTTNYNKERYAVVGNSKMVFAFLRQGDIVGEASKDGGFLSNITKFIQRLAKKNTNYRWL